MENTTSQLYDEMNSWAVRIQPSSDTILAANDNLCHLDFAKENQVSNKHLGIGTETWVLQNLKPPPFFFEAVRGFYISSTKKMLNKFPFGDTLLKDLSVLQPENTSPFSKIISLANIFPQIGLSDSASLDSLKEEFQDFKLSPGDLPSVVKYKAADGVMRSKAGLFWSEIKKMTTLDGQPRFTLLHQLMTGLLSIPISNADSERGFSMLRKIHTD